MVGAWCGRGGPGCHRRRERESWGEERSCGGHGREERPCGRNNQSVRALYLVFFILKKVHT
jgi:hypothetical protein